VRKRRARKGMGTIVDDIMTRDPISTRAEDAISQVTYAVNSRVGQRLTNPYGG
jgi:hypothetical protein